MRSTGTLLHIEQNRARTRRCPGCSSSTRRATRPRSQTALGTSTAPPSAPRAYRTWWQAVCDMRSYCRLGGQTQPPAGVTCMRALSASRVSKQVLACSMRLARRTLNNSRPHVAGELLHTLKGKQYTMQMQTCVLKRHLSWELQGHLIQVRSICSRGAHPGSLQTEHAKPRPMSRPSQRRRRAVAANGSLLSSSPKRSGQRSQGAALEPWCSRSMSSTACGALAIVPVCGRDS